MRECDVRTIAQALAYVTDCNLATVCNMASKKSRPKHEYDRQINIAQKAINWMREMGVDERSTRATDVCRDIDGVRVWARKYEPKD